MAKDFGGAAPKASPQPAAQAPAIPRSVGGDFTAPAPRLRPEDARPFVLIWSHGYHSTPSGPLPTLFPQRVEGGICGARVYKDGRVDISGLVEDARKGGKVVLDWALGYCLEVEPNSNTWRPVWARVVDGKIVEDHAAYEAWVRQLMTDGHIPAPTARDLEIIEEREAALLAKPVEAGGHVLTIGSLERNLQATRDAKAALGAP